MLNAAEAAMDQAAEDDKERARNHARLYAPPKGMKRTRGAPRHPGAAMNAGQAKTLMAQLAAQDAQLARGAGG
jgi:hypothetical protein